MADRFILRRVWFQAHLWIGIALFLVLAPLSAAGSMLVWDGALDRLIHPQRHAISGPARLPLETYAASARSALGRDRPVTTIRMPEESGDPVVVSAPMTKAGYGATRRRAPSFNVYLDPASGRILDTGRSDAGLVRWLHVFHGSLQMPGLGRKIVGWMGWAMTVSALTGIWLWWPRSRGLLRGLRWRRAPLVSSNLHHQVGFWMSIPLAVLAFTGVCISFPQSFRAVVASAGGPALPAGDRPPREARGGGEGRPTPMTRMSVDQAVEAASATAPGAELVSAGWPTTGKARWSIRLRRSGAPQVTVSVDDDTGAVQATPARFDTATRSARLMRMLHDGRGAGVVWRVIIFAAGWAPAVLGVSGVLMWIRNRGPRSARNAWRQSGRGAA
jgi:uncharacterized iron-regulated membrane protein